MKDPIEREKAIEAVADEIWHYPNERYKNLNVFENAKDLAEHALRGLPSAQPDLNEWCTDCKEYDAEKHHCPRFNRVIREALKDAGLEIIYCKECVKHNIGDDDTPYKSYVCPLVKFRGKAQGHEFDYQYCVYGVKKDERPD